MFVASFHEGLFELRGTAERTKRCSVGDGEAPAASGISVFFVSDLLTGALDGTERVYAGEVRLPLDADRCHRKPRRAPVPFAAEDLTP